MDGHPPDHRQRTDPPVAGTDLQQAIADRLAEALDMLEATGASVPAERGLAAGGLIRLTVDEVARLAAQVTADGAGSWRWGGRDSRRKVPIRPGVRSHSCSLGPNGMSLCDL